MFNDTNYGQWKNFMIVYNYNGTVNQSQYAISYNNPITLPNPNLYYVKIQGATYGSQNVTTAV